jgi:ATP-dependent DNA helicase PIF1
MKQPQPQKTPASSAKTKQFGKFGRGGAALQSRPTGEFKRDESYEASAGVAEALAAVDAGAPAVLIIGRAGTGKTRLVQYLKARPGGELQATVAPTGIAALNAQAQTIHSFFRLEPTVLDAANLSDGGKFGNVYRRMKRLIIDEISMVRADLIDAMDARLRKVRADRRRFGGVQIVMVGDFLQLPPVIQPNDWPVLEALGYRGPFAFNAHALADLPVKTVALDRVWRQDEQEFIEILGHIRSGEAVGAALERLNVRCVGPHRDGVAPLLLTATRAAADGHNKRGLQALGGERAGFQAKIDREFTLAAASLPVPEHIELAVGARVMAVKNDGGGRWVNGSLGTVTGFSEDGVTVMFDRGHQEHLVSPVAWEKVRQQWNETTKRIETEVVAAYRQIPLIHAWAVTIHKAQGLTLDDVRIDLGSGAFAAGQVYVAISRVRSLSGLSFARPLRVSDIQVDPMLVEFMRWVQLDDSPGPQTIARGE